MSRSMSKKIGDYTVYCRPMETDGLPYVNPDSASRHMTGALFNIEKANSAEIHTTEEQERR